MLIEVVRDNYICINPLDEGKKQFEKSEMKCGKVVDMVK